MHQKGKQGGGKHEENFYETWEIKICPVCFLKVREYYLVEILSE
jgi:hypothetical protein